MNDSKNNANDYRPSDLKELQLLQAKLQEQMDEVTKDIERIANTNSDNATNAEKTNSQVDVGKSHNDRNDIDIDSQALRRLKERHIRNDLDFFRDENDINDCLEREKRFQVKWNRLSRNKLWSKNTGLPVIVYDGSVKDYTENPVKTGCCRRRTTRSQENNNNIWPRGRDLNDLSVYGQIYDFTAFMWAHTKPYKTVFMIMLMAITKPLTTAAISYVASSVEANPTAVPFWLYLTTFFIECYDRILYWWYEMWVPLNSQRVQMRSVLLSKRLSLPDNHPVAIKWPKGRFTALLKDVDEVINGIWKTFLTGFDDAVSVLWLLVLCFSNLALPQPSTQNLSQDDYIVYVAIFTFLGILTLCAPLLWFNMVYGKVQTCESMVREGQALYMSYSGAAISGQHSASSADAVGRKAFRVYGLTTFRSFFYALAWKTNFSLLMKLIYATAAYGLLTLFSFGQSNLASILIVLVALAELSKLSPTLLEKFITMSKGCHVLRDVAELLNADASVVDSGCFGLDEMVETDEKNETS